MNVIHWYPGHMKKASNEMLDILKLVDIVIELVDARAPSLTSNPFFKNVIKDKPHILAYMKSDLADIKKVHLPNNAVLVDIHNQGSINNLISLIMKANETRINKAVKKGIKAMPPRVMIVGIPNVGKSSLINALAHKKITQVENRPGLTKKNHWLYLNNKFYLLDTPGILPSDYLITNYVLGLIGSIKIELLPIVELSDFAYDLIIKNYPQLFIKRYGEIMLTSNESFKHIADIRGIKNDNTLNHERARSLFLKDIRDGNLGKIYLE